MTAARTATVIVEPVTVPTVAARPATVIVEVVISPKPPGGWSVGTIKIGG